MQTYQLTQILKKRFIGADDLRKSLSDIIEKLPDEKNEIVITQHGKAKAILLDVNTYLELTDIQEDIIQPGYIDTLYKELEAVKKGNGIDPKNLYANSQKNTNH